MLGEKIRELRKKHKITMKTLGTKLKLSESAIAMYEKNKRIPDYETLKQIAEYFNVTVAFLLDEGLFQQKELVIEFRELITNELRGAIGDEFANLVMTLSDEYFMCFLSPIVEKIECDDKTHTLKIFYHINFEDSQPTVKDDAIKNRKKIKPIPPLVLSSPEQNHIKKYRVLDEHGKEVVDNLLNSEHNRITRLEQERLERERREKEKIINPPTVPDKDEPEIIEIKVYSQPAAAGIGNYLTDDDDYDLVAFPEDEVPSRADFGVRISGDSMEPEIHDGDIVWVEAMPQIEDGEIGIFILNGDSLCKKLHLKGRQAKLISLNNIKYDPIEIYEDDNLRTVGKVLF